MNKEGFFSFLPLHLSALERSFQLKNWILNWASIAKDIIFLQPKDCFSKILDFAGMDSPHLSALERPSQLKDWILDWASQLKDWILDWAFNTKYFIFLKPEDWHVKGRDIAGMDSIPILKSSRMLNPSIYPRMYNWASPPAAFDVALEEPHKARMKCHTSTHVVIIQRMSTNLWRKQFLKYCNLIFDVPAHFDFWKHDMSQLSKSLLTMPKCLVRELLYFEQSC